MPRLPNDPIKRARKRLASAAFGFIDLDELDKAKPPGEKAEGRNLARHYKAMMPIVGEIVPEVDSALDHVCERLDIPREIIHGFIESSGEMNASCRSSSRAEGQAVLTITSAAVERLSYDEMVYVFGHEIGHYIFPHEYLTDARSRVASMEDARISRGMEIFMDRIGLIACRNVSFATSAAMKIASGLSSAHMRSNVSAYSDEAIKGFGAAPDGHDFMADHPPLFLRVRALMLYATSDSYMQLLGKEGGRPVGEVNKEVETDLHNTVDSVARANMLQLLSNIPNFLAAFAQVKGDAVAPAEFNLEGMETSKKEVDEWLDAMKKVPAEKLDEVFKEKVMELARNAAMNCPRFAIGYLEKLSDKLKGKQVQTLALFMQNMVKQALDHHLNRESLRYTR